MFYSDLFYRIIVGVDGYCCAWPHSLTHTHTHTHSRTLVVDGSDRRRDLYLTTHETHNRQTSMLPAAFEPAFPVSQRRQTYA